MSLTIVGTGYAVPAHIVRNDDLAQIVDTSDAWVRTRTGIQTRRLLGARTLADLACEAAQAALADAHLGAQDIDLILCTTICADTITPGLCTHVQHRIGAHCPGLDLNAACAGFVYALDVAQAYLLSGKAQRILIVSAEALSRFTDWTDRTTCVLFGDGAGAAVVQPGADLLDIRLLSEPHIDWLYANSPMGNSPFFGQPNGNDDTYIHMNGQEVYKYAVRTVAQQARDCLNAAGVTPDQVDLYVLHQANRRILDAVRTRLGQPAEKFPDSIHCYGNTSSASLPILLSQLCREGRVSDGMLLFLSAFGAGMTAGSCLLRWHASPPSPHRV